MIAFEVSTYVQGDKKATSEKVGRLALDSPTLEDIDYFIEDIVSAQISYAMGALKYEQQYRAFDKNPVTYVNGVKNSNLLSLKFGKAIEYYSRVNSEEIVKAIREIWQMIKARSIVDTGTYKNANYLVFNKTTVLTDDGEFERWANGMITKGFSDKDRIRFINVTPYARKLERRGFSRAHKDLPRFKRKEGDTVQNIRKPKISKVSGKQIMQPNGAYYLTYRTMARKYSFLGRRLSYKIVPNGNDGLWVPGSARFRNTFIKSGRPYLYPTIVLDLSGDAINKGEAYV